MDAQPPSPGVPPRMDSGSRHRHLRSGLGYPLCLKICCRSVAIFEFEEPLGSLEAFLAALEDIEAGQKPAYPFYCALIYTAAGGADARISDYLAASWEELDGLTGDKCLVFLIADRAPRPIVRDRPFTPAEVYRVADELGVRASALPCAAFFVDPATSRELLRVQLGKYLPADPDHAILTDAFRGIADALHRCRPASQSTRLDCLRAELIEEHEHLMPAVSTGQRLQEAGAWSDALQKVVTVGASIAAVIAGVVR